MPNPPLPPDLLYRDMRPDEVGAVTDLVLRVFREWVAPFLSPKGVEEFLSFSSAEALAERLNHGHYCLVAESKGRLVGMIEIRLHRHVCRLFVESLLQRRGMGRKLLDLAVQRCRQENPGLERLTVNAAPNAYEAYRRMGFAPTGPEQTHNDITFMPMTLALDPDTSPRPAGDPQ